MNIFELQDCKNHLAKLQADGKIVDEIETTEKNVIHLAEITRYNWKNKDDSSDDECPICKSWKKHWEKFSKKTFDEQPCSNEGCPDKAKGEKAKHGAHVINPSDNGVWIVPLCAKCNNTNNTDFFDLRSGTILVGATKCEEKT